ncbi:18316_t:CDS:2 [Acaulospora morrowiae]|uniref:18316_t:CDS:1 n=1 Tax=Acaulospora morrowiae TaxID=94023 RepID=A0A9N9BAN9_9GLOM|nr:18316_t:CDS:2 [Acaulospora morrowiae]
MDSEVYEILETCGEGTFGIVYKARQKSTGTLVAVKKAFEVRYERPARERIANEIKILRSVEHENIISIFSSDGTYKFVDSSSRILFCSDETNKTSIIFPYCPLTLKDLLENYVLTFSEKKSCIWMILNGVAHIHESAIIHRDLSPRNILINGIGVVKIADFGVAWADTNNNFEPRGEMKFEVGTRHYRAPELLFSAGNYTNVIDLWSLGCIFAEFYTKPVGSPLFDGGSDIEQLSKIFRVLGIPTEKSWPEMKDFPDYGKLTFKIKECLGLTELQLPEAHSPGVIQFISKFLKYSFNERMTANRALQDSIFDSDDFSKIRIELDKLKRASQVPG